MNQIRFDAAGLVPVVTQDARSGEILMLAYASREALEETLRSGYAHYWSRSRRSLWRKGETSGNVQEVVEVRIDCDGDTLLYRVRQSGPACHTGKGSCFYRALDLDGETELDSSPGHILDRVDEAIEARRAQPREGSYTNYLFDKGVDKILKKVGEEATEVVVAAKNEDPVELRAEVADLLYHLLVLLRERNLPLGAVWKELDERFGRPPRARKPENTDTDDER